MKTIREEIIEIDNLISKKLLTEFISLMVNTNIIHELTEYHDINNQTYIFEIHVITCENTIDKVLEIFNVQTNSRLTISLNIYKTTSSEYLIPTIEYSFIDKNNKDCIVKIKYQDINKSNSIILLIRELTFMNNEELLNITNVPSLKMHSNLIKASSNLDDSNMIKIEPTIEYKEIDIRECIIGIDNNKINNLQMGRSYSNVILSINPNDVRQRVNKFIDLFYLEYNRIKQSLLNSMENNLINYLPLDDLLNSFKKIVIREEDYLTHMSNKNSRKRKEKKL